MDFDPYLLTKWKDQPPNFRRMFNNDSEVFIESTFPPDSVCTWTSIYTAENPADKN
jgi:predicted AlkP superfamily phosphohydrolase/phosphomutase